eukprot:TRINITY_DN1198_c0_g1_i2.p1 TRINITY_DN1198_c0_g1~~TRINITY_DN1198_c0_g1_i2.p1  ORF type:complete len:477 (+),score=41.25 TRINITY_DN1198_c0_g1_i2:47-1477(+)
MSLPLQHRIRSLCTAVNSDVAVEDAIDSVLSGRISLLQCLEKLAQTPDRMLRAELLLHFPDVPVAELDRMLRETTGGRALLDELRQKYPHDRTASEDWHCTCEERRLTAKWIEVHRELDRTLNQSANRNYSAAIAFFVHHFWPGEDRADPGGTVASMFEIYTSCVREQSERQTQNGGGAPATWHGGVPPMWQSHAGCAQAVLSSGAEAVAPTIQRHRPTVGQLPGQLPDVYCAGATDGQEEVPLQDLDDMGLLGKGGQGTVTKVRHKTTQEVFALKRIPIESGAADRMRRQVECEIKRVKEWRHPNLVQHVCASYRGPELFILMEHVSCGTLSELCDKAHALQIGVPVRVLGHIAEQVLGGLNYLHTGVDGQVMVHRDVKPCNMLVHEDGTVKVADFGIARVLRPHESASTNCGTIGYMSPERQLGNDYHSPCDIWAVGVTMVKLALGWLPSELQWPEVLRSRESPGDALKKFVAA